MKLLSLALSLVIVLVSRSSSKPTLDRRYDHHEYLAHSPPSLRHVEEKLVPVFPVEYHSQRVKVRYPALEVPSTAEENNMITFKEMNTIMPCQNCVILEMSSDLEYENGTRAGLDTGVSLHHTVFVNTGRNDHLCGMQAFGQRFYATGNERTVVDFSAHGGRLGGYYIAEDDQVFAQGELMNMSHERQRVVFSTTYEYVSNLPKSYTMVEPIWLDIGSCGGSRIHRQPEALSVYSSSVWNSSLTGNVTWAGGHLHEGGAQVQLFQNGRLVCEPTPTYRDPTSHTSSYERKEYIESMSTCSDFATTLPGDEWSIKAIYDTSLHRSMRGMDGSLEPVMGISILYVATQDHESSMVLMKDDEGHGILLTIFVALAAASVGYGCYRHRQHLSGSLYRWKNKTSMKIPGQIDQELRLPFLSHGQATS